MDEMQKTMLALELVEVLKNLEGITKMTLETPVMVTEILTSWIDKRYPMAIDPKTIKVVASGSSIYVDIPELRGIFDR